MGKELQEKVRYFRRKGFKVFEGFNRRANEASDLFRSGEYCAVVNGLEGLVSELDEQIEEKEEKQIPTKIKCPKCGSPIIVESDERLLEITCDNCGARGCLR